MNHVKHIVLAASLALTAHTTQAQLVAEVQTTAGTMWFELDEANTPKTVQNFSHLVQQHWYEHKSFYRVVAGHVIQVGLNDDNHPDMQRYAVAGEFHGTFTHKRGCLGLARGESPDSGGTEIYVCHADRPHLDGRYAVFGRLIDGQEVLDRIATAKVKEVWLDNPGGKPIAFHQPVAAITINKITLLRN